MNHTKEAAAQLAEMEAAAQKERDAEAAAHMEKAAAHDQEAADSFARCDTDGFVTQWAHGINGQLERAKAVIAERGGVQEFPALLDADGERVPAILIPTRYGECWAICEPGTDRFTGEFVGRGKVALKKAGFHEDVETAPARADLWAPPGARGLAGATQVRVVVSRTDAGYPGAVKTR